MDQKELKETVEQKKKRHLSEVSKSSSSPSPVSKMSKPQSLGEVAACKDITEEGVSDNSSMAEEGDNVLSLISDPSNMSDMSLHDKMDTVIHLLQSMRTEQKSNKETTDTDIKSLQEQNRKLELKLKESEGRATRMQREIDSLKVTYEALQLRSMSNNIIIHNIAENTGENIYQVVHDVLVNKLRIPENLIHSDRHPAGPVQVDIAHRLGRYINKVRPIVVKLVLKRGKEIIFNHTKHLKGLGIIVSEQFPAAIREKRALLYRKMKYLREQHKEDRSTRIILSRDKLLINNSAVPDQFKINPLSDVTLKRDMPVDYSSLIHSEVIEYSGSIFQGHAIKVTTVQEAKAAYLALLQNNEVATAHHISYAYTVHRKSKDATAITLTGHDDDGEFGASKILLDVLTKTENTFIAVSRLHKGPNIGKKGSN